MRRLLSAVALSLAVLGCGDDRPMVRLFTEGTVFDRGGTGVVPEATVPFTVTNHSDQTVFLPGCAGRLSLATERGAGDHWEQYNGAFCLAVELQTPIELRAGASVTSESYFYESGSYRFRLSWGTNPSTVYGNDASVSNSFSIR